MTDLSNALLSNIKEELLKGLPLIVYDFDGREEEADMVFYAGSVSWKSINRLRKDAGGLICYVTGREEASMIGLKFLTDEWKSHPIYQNLIKKPSYGDYPSFTMWVNHISVSTGISDTDRANTIRELHNLLTDHIEKKEEHFLRNFYAPGHVPVLASRGIDQRRGHTELVSQIAELAGLPRSMVIAEMLGDGRSLKRVNAEEYASKNNLIFLEGKDIIGVQRK
ncbi:MAG: 3,4-dihydroxy-2-butanone-4-phosphate synthase [Thermoplasmatales archaeon]|nr:3,4-dihydroxy-2-butanone-4-phosphate synthase [Candidatus Thermoplasmatota archaeon]MCL6003610.1 3,4-dihydroxy-2-butanone-4-phosphate synthase [Candidatus Thermoplasmatota archaeon]MDA8054986.1 3,4-dihydroxy-2-butanone-4-phosphate synthase [Thermoplasmatales archaeon]